jgi:hypothetical protein
MRVSHQRAFGQELIAHNCGAVIAKPLRMTAALLLLALAGGIAGPPSASSYQDPPRPKQRPPGKLGPHDQTLRFASSTLIVADWLTTIDGIRKGWEETNPLLGRRPSLGRVNAMIGAGLVVNTFAVPKIKNPHVRRAVWFGVLLAEVHAVYNNRKEGCGFSFSF